MPPLSAGPPTMAVLPSWDSDTEKPWLAFPAASLPTNSRPCWVHTPWRRVYIAAPLPEPTMAVFPSADSDTERPCPIVPCWVHTPWLRVNIHAAPLPEPTMAVFPSADSATDRPWLAFPTAPLPTSFGPCWVNCASATWEEESSVAKISTDAPNNLTTFTLENNGTHVVIEISCRFENPLAPPEFQQREQQRTNTRSRHLTKRCYHEAMLSERSFDVRDVPHTSSWTSRIFFFPSACSSYAQGRRSRPY